MKKLSTFVFVCFFATSSFAQEFIKKFDSDFCNCISNEKVYTDKTFEDCSDKVIPKYQQELEQLYKAELKTNDYEKGLTDGKDFMNDFMVRLIKNCDAFYYHMEDLKKIGMNSFKREYENTKLDLLSQKFKESQSISDYWEMANWNFANNRYSEAEKMYNEILKNEPEQFESIYMLALLYDELGNYKGAKFLYDKVYEKYPKIEYKLYSEMDSRKIK